MWKSIIFYLVDELTCSGVYAVAADDRMMMWVEVEIYLYLRNIIIIYPGIMCI